MVDIILTRYSNQVKVVNHISIKIKRHIISQNECKGRVKKLHKLSLNLNAKVCSVPMIRCPAANCILSLFLRDPGEGGSCRRKKGRWGRGRGRAYQHGEFNKVH